MTTTFLRSESTGNSVSPQPQPHLQRSSDSFGQQLRRARKKLELSIEDVAERTKLDPRQITALEEERFDELPSMTFVRGFVRQYARVLNLDEAPLLTLLPAPAAQVHLSTPHLGVVPRPKDFGLKGFESRRHRTTKILFLLLLIAGLVAGGFLLLRYRSPFTAAQPNASATTSAETGTLAPLTQNLPQTSLSTPSTITTTTTTTLPPLTSPAGLAGSGAAAVASTATPSTTIAAPPVSTPESVASPAAIAHAPAPGSDPAIPIASKSNGHLKVKAAASLPPQIELSFEERSWVEIKDAQGNLLLAQINQPGSRQNVKGTPPYDITIGNPRAVTMQYKGVTLDVRPYTAHDTAHFTLD